MEKRSSSRKKRGWLTLGRVIFVLILIAIFTFGMNNRLRVPVWPFENHPRPLYWVIGVTFLLGFLSGWFGHTQLRGRRIALVDDHKNAASTPTQQSEG